MQPNLDDLQHEIDFIHNSLMPDTKNYHTWAYLNWLYSHFSNLPEAQGGNRFAEDSWAKELEWCNHMLDSTFKFEGPRVVDENAAGKEDISSTGVDQDASETFGHGDGRNNSAWSWRWHLVIARTGASPDPEVEIE